MSCVSPLTLKINGEQIKVNCGQCLQCRIKYQSELEFIANKELLGAYKKGLGASFITLTYDDIHIPKTEENKITLRKSDLQKFFKRIRKNQADHKNTIKFKYIATGELGGKYQRPHYHIVIIGLCYELAYKYTKKAWKFGLIDVGPLSAGGLRYILKYCTKSKPTTDIKAFYNTVKTEPPFLIHSQGIGKEWLDENTEKIINDGFKYNIAGKEKIYPTNVLKYIQMRTGIEYKSQIQEFYNKENIKIKNITDKSIENYKIEKAIIKEKQLIESLRSKGITTPTEAQMSKNWVKPRTKNNLNEIIKKLNENEGGGQKSAPTVSLRSCRLDFCPPLVDSQEKQKDLKSKN